MMMQDVGYVRVINTLHGRTGTLWEARFRSSLIDSENYLLVCQLGSSPAERRSAYLSLFAKSLDDLVVARIREAINSDSAFGSDAFLDDAEAKLGRSVRLPVRGRPAKSVTGKLL